MEYLRNLEQKIIEKFEQEAKVSPFDSVSKRNGKEGHPLNRREIHLPPK
jgi:hypothetical protein